MIFGALNAIALIVFVWRNEKQLFEQLKKLRQSKQD
jgi:hypothetical protein